MLEAAASSTVFSLRIELVFTSHISGNSVFAGGFMLSVFQLVLFS
jgi:hypothetical protein